MKKTKKSQEKNKKKYQKKIVSFLAKAEGKTIRLLRAKHAKTFYQRFRGLMWVKPGEFDYALVFHLNNKGKHNASIHMLFMNMPIDVLFLDEDKKIVDLVENLQPWIIHYAPKKEAKYIVEMPEGSIKKYRPKLGEKIEW